jgi:hypothetical protein
MTKLSIVNLRKNFGRKTALLCAALTVLLLSCAPSASAADRIAERIMNAWSKTGSYRDGSGGQFLNIRVTYYAAEYIEALVRSEAEKNLWTSDEEDSFKYNLLKTLNLDDTIAFHIEFDVTGSPLYLQPFDRQLKLYAGRTVLEPVDYDQRFNFKLQGKRDGMIWFPRHDPKTGKSYLDGIKDLRLQISNTISMATSRTGDLRFVWDITGDNPAVLGTGAAAARLELDRLIRRLDKLKDDKKALEEQLYAVNSELAEIDARVDDLQRQ